VILEDEEIHLRPFEETDVQALVACLNDPEISRWTRIPFPYTEADAVEFMRSTNERAFAITDRRSGELLGGIGMRMPSGGVGEVGYWVKREARGRGLATRALRLLARWALEDQRLARVQLAAEPGNLASLRVAEKAGFTREGLLRRYLNIGGERRDGFMFSLLPEELGPQGPPRATTRFRA
jgi:RimJ/RimL family protein N-acetyltransferase